MTAPIRIMVAIAVVAALGGEAGADSCERWKDAVVYDGDTDGDPVVGVPSLVLLYWRRELDVAFVQVAMEKTYSGAYEFPIRTMDRDLDANGGRIRYYIRAFDDAGNVVASLGNAEVPYCADIEAFRELCAGECGCNGCPPRLGDVKLGGPDPKWRPPRTPAHYRVMLSAGSGSAWGVHVVAQGSAALTRKTRLAGLARLFDERAGTRTRPAGAGFVRLLRYFRSDGAGFHVHASCGGGFLDENVGPILVGVGAGYALPLRGQLDLVAGVGLLAGLGLEHALRVDVELGVSIGF